MSICIWLIACSSAPTGVRSSDILVLLEHHDRARQLRLDQPAHREHAAADRFHLGVELLVRVFGHRVLSGHRPAASAEAAGDVILGFLALAA